MKYDTLFAIIGIGVLISMAQIIWDLNKIITLLEAVNG